jgi:hypothetical protein
MQPKGSLPHSQEPATCPYHEPDQNSPYPILLLADTFQYYPTTYAFISQVVPSLSFPSNTLYAPLLISFFLIWSPD